MWAKFETKKMTRVENGTLICACETFVFIGNLFVETFKNFRKNIFKEAKVDTDLYNVLYELQHGIGKFENEGTLILYLCILLL